MASQCSPAFAAHVEAARARLQTALADGSVCRAGPSSVSWKINREIVVVAGWGRAILLQFAHPLVAEGVATHSSFRAHSLAGFGRLWSTVRAMLSLTFGSDEDMLAAAAAINVIHDRVFGTLPSGVGPFAAGTPYSAHQADLLRWVHATLLESLPLTYQRLVAPLTSAEKDRYCAETALMEPLLGIPAGLLPRRTQELDRYMRGMLEGGEIAVGPAARGLARAVLYPPRSGVLWPAFRPVRLLTLGTLPPAVREAYGFGWGMREERSLARWESFIRAARRALPRPLREWPSARRRRGSREEPGIACAF